jgi:dTDP-4-amino-4,6-dideoxygalactose transaminase
VAQLEQLPVFLKRKRDIFSQYQTAFDNIAGLTLAGVPDYAGNNHWMNLLQIDKDAYGEDREELMQRLDENGIQTRPVWALNHLQEPYREFQNYHIEYAEKLINNSLCLPSSTNLSHEDQLRVINNLMKK